MNPQKIVRLEVENIKKLKAVTIRPEGNVVVIAGANGSGKTSTLDAISMAFTGKNAIPQVPIRRGQASAFAEVQTEDYLIRRTITAEGGGTLTVKSADGSARFSSPQALLDKIVGDLAFDPLAFTREKPAAQVEILRKLTGLDFTKIDAQYAEAYAKRRDTSRNVGLLRAAMAGRKLHTGVPENEIIFSGIRDRHAAALTVNEDNANIRRSFALREDTLRAKRERRSAVELEIEELDRKIQDLKLKSAELLMEIWGWEETIEADRPQVDALQDVDISAIVAEMGEADDINRKVRENHELAGALKAIKDQSDDVDALTAQLEDLAQAKRTAMANAKFPVPGLSFDEGGVLLNDVPFEQASTAERIRVSVAMGMALNPVLRVMFVRDGSLLDAESMKLVCAMAAEHDYQLWIETVATDTPAAIVIEDGAVKGAEVPEPAAA